MAKIPAVKILLVAAFRTVKALCSQRSNSNSGQDVTPMSFANLTETSLLGGERDYPSSTNVSREIEPRIQYFETE
jgi:hypothetical protein